MILGILGGMGPLATSELFRKIVKYDNGTKDQDYVHIIVDNNTKIPDRTAFICNQGEDPRIEMIRSLIKLEISGCDYIVMPCNTAHVFYDDIKKYTTAKIIHIVRETAIHAKNYIKSKKYLLLATEGTYKSEVYKKEFEKLDLQLIIPNDSDKKIIMKWIYDLKAGKIDATSNDLSLMVDKYKNDDEVSVILGCTELPLFAQAINYDKPYIDPLEIVSKKVIEYKEYDENLTTV